MFIHGSSTFISTKEKSIQDLKNELKKYSDQNFRRTNKFILLSMLGVHICLQNKFINEDTSIYLATENGALSDTENVLNQLYQEHKFPMPITFINTMNNTATFYIAKSLEVKGRNITVSSKNFSFERGLEIFQTDLESRIVSNALIGGIDEAAFSKTQFETKFENVSFEKFNHIDGSAWLYMKPEKDGAIGEILDIKSYKDKKSAIIWFESFSVTGPVILSFGILIDLEEKKKWISYNKHDDEFNYISNFGYFDTATACGVSKFLEKYSRSTLIHINKDHHGKYVFLIVKKY